MLSDRARTAVYSKTLRRYSHLSPDVVLGGV